MATMITTGAETIPAVTAASPMISAPTMVTAEPTSFGRRSPASRTASKASSISTVSTMVGKGIRSRDDAKVKSCSVGTASG